MKFVLLKGLGRESRHWGEFILEIKRAFPDSEVELLDFPGSGKHLKKISPLSVSGITDFLRKQTLKGRDKRVLVGISLGSMVAMDWITRFPDDFAGCVLINGSSRGLSPVWERLKPGSYPMLFKFLTSRTAEQKEKSILDFTVNSDECREGLLLEWTKYQAEAPISALNSAFQLIAATRFSLKNKPKTPCLVLTSRKDRMVSKRCSEKISRFLGAPLKYHPTAGHELGTEDGAWVAREIHSWISQNPL